MSFKCYGTAILTADMGAKPSYWQPFLPTRNRIIKAIRTALIFYNDPVFSSAELELWKVANNSLWKKIATSNMRKKSSMITKDYGTKYCYFDFEIMPSLRKNITYALVLRLSDYVGEDGSHIALAREAYPYMQHAEDPITRANITSAPYIFSIVGDRF